MNSVPAKTLALRTVKISAKMLNMRTPSGNAFIQRDFKGGKL